MRRNYTNKEIEDLYLEMIGQLKTDQSRKIMLMKWLREAECVLEDLEEAVIRPPASRYYLGDFITSLNVVSARNEVRILKELRSQFN